MRLPVVVKAAVLFAAITGIAVAQEIGKEAPALKISDARGVKKEFKLADLKGKWVIIDFWATWCPPCVKIGLPHLKEFYEKHKDKHGKFEILAFHDPSAKTFEDFDKKAEKLEKDVWKGKLPFPILLDASGETLRSYGVRAFPTIVLIDPEGKIAKIEVGAGGEVEKLLEEKLK